MGLHLQMLELDGLTADPASPPNGCIWFRSDEGIFYGQITGAKRAIAILQNLPRYDWAANELVVPNNADFPVNAFAGGGADTKNAAIQVRRFDSTIEEGMATKKIWIPAGVTKLKVSTVARAQTAPAGVRTVGLKAWARSFPDNAAPSAWPTPANALVLADIDIPTNDNDQYDSEIMTLADLNLTAGEFAQLEITRVAPQGGTNLAADWTLSRLALEPLL